MCVIYLELNPRYKDVAIISWRHVQDFTSTLTCDLICLLICYSRSARDIMQTGLEIMQFLNTMLKKRSRMQDMHVYTKNLSPLHSKRSACYLVAPMRMHLFVTK